VIGTNKPDAAETVACMMDDRTQGRLLRPEAPEAAAVEGLLRQRQPLCFSYGDWRRLDELEVAAGRRVGRPRIKFTSVEDMAAALGRRAE
jgi:ferredoxin--NADP+ reductase